MKSSFWQNLTAVLVTASFIAANLDYGRAYDLWANGAEAILVFMGLGIFGKMSHRVMERFIDAKYQKKEVDQQGEKNGNL